MAKIELNGNIATITSNVKLDDIKRLQKLDPKSLVITETDGEESYPVFRVMAGQNPSVDNNGIVFANKTRNGGFATISKEVIVDDDATDEQVLDALYDQFIVPFKYLEEIEGQIPAALGNAEAARRLFVESVTIR